MRPETIAIVGAGRLGSTLALRLSDAGFKITEIIARELIMLSPKGGGGEGAKVAARAAPEGKAAESLEAFPEALDEEDDDLPF